MPSVSDDLSIFRTLCTSLISDPSITTTARAPLDGLIASCFGLGATLSNFLGQMVVEHYGYVASLTGSLVLSIIPIILFSNMPETYGLRGQSRIVDYKTQSLNV